MDGFQLFLRSRFHKDGMTAGLRARVAVFNNNSNDGFAPNAVNNTSSAKRTLWTDYTAACYVECFVCKFPRGRRSDSSTSTMTI